MKLMQRTGFLYFFVQWSVTIDLGYAYLETSVGGYLFTLHDFKDQEKRTQPNAQAWCITNQSKLLEIASGSLQSSAVTFINNALRQNQMSGNKIITNGKRFRSTFTWVNGNPWRSSLQVNEQDPTYVRGYGYLNSILSGYSFVADAPTVTRGYICEGSSFCAGGFRSNDRCYRSYNETLPWFGARNRCLDGGGDLASFEFISNAQGFSVLNGSGWNQSSTYWIGLQRLIWKWQGTNSDVKYSQWYVGHPDYTTNENNDCLCLNPNPTIYDWKWIECDCSQTYQFVCFAEIESTSSTSSATTFNVISSAQIKTSTTTSQSVSSPPSITNSGYSFTTTLSITGVPAGSGYTENYKLPVGLGVGLGGGALIAVIIVIVVVVVRRKECHRQPGLQKPSPNPPDVTKESYYATVVKNPEYDDTAIDINQIPPPTEYADLNIVATSQAADEKEQSRRSLV